MFPLSSLRNLISIQLSTQGGTLWGSLLSGLWPVNSDPPCLSGLPFCLPNYGRLGFAWIPSPCVRAWKLSPELHGTTAGLTSFVSHISGIIVISRLVSSVWEPWLHVFCPFCCWCCRQEGRSGPCCFILAGVKMSSCLSKMQICSGHFLLISIEVPWWPWPNNKKG